MAPDEPTRMTPSQSDDTQEDRVVGRYVVEQLIGKGGMGEVYVARQEGAGGFQKRVVVKRIRGALARDPKFVQMFLREARLLARMNHSNIVQVLDVDEDAASSFIAMEYVDGINAQELARRRWQVGDVVPVEVALRIVADTALGLDYAHHFVDENGASAGLVHRDISPDNLLVNRQGVTKICDFGLAKSEDATTLTNPGELRGKLPYMAPEYVTGAAIDGRADLWSLGVTAYWLLTGALPFLRDTPADTTTAIVELPPEAPSKHRALKKNVDALVLSLLEKDPARRPQSGKAVHDTIIAMLGSNAGHHVTAAVVGSLIDDRDRGVPIGRAMPPSIELVSAMLIEDKPMPVWVAPAAAALVAVVCALLVPLPAVEEKPVVVAIAPATPVEPAKIDAPKVDAPKVDAAPIENDVADEPPATPTPATTTHKKLRGDAKKRTVELVAPNSVVWSTSSSGELGRGKITATIPAGTALIARDTTRNITTTINDVPAHLEYASLPKGKLAVRAIPWADVSIGSVSLGQTPFAPVVVVAGRVKVKLVWNGNERVVDVDVPANGIGRVAENMK